MLCWHSTESIVLSLSVNEMMLPSELRRLRHDGSSSVAVIFVCILSLDPSVNVTQNCRLSASKDKYPLCSLKNVLKLATY
jgi:hypothetical protein